MNTVIDIEPLPLGEAADPVSRTNTRGRVILLVFAQLPKRSALTSLSLPRNVVDRDGPTDTEVPML